VTQVVGSGDSSPAPDHHRLLLSEDSYDVLVGDCRKVMVDLLPSWEGRFDSIVTDPPYELGFMGKSWDRGGVSCDPEVWRLALRLLRPGGHLLAFGGSRTYHRMASAIEDAGFEIRDQIMWLYGQGFPKSLDVSKAIDKAAEAEREIVGPRVRVDGKKPGHSALSANQTFGSSVDLSQLVETVPATEEARQWQGWGTALKPAHEPIVLARRPLSEPTVAANVLRYGTGALNVDGCRIPTNGGESLGRFPANVVHDGSDEVEEAFAEFGDKGGGFGVRGRNALGLVNDDGWKPSKEGHVVGFGDSGSASRFFYCAKASRSDREDGVGGKNEHPTVKPTELMRWLVRLVTPPGGLVLDPFCGTGSTGRGALSEGARFVGIESDSDYAELAMRRIEAVRARTEGGSE
jgi:site-specific DNA-methyltransferase (adenine-specific)